MYKGYCIKHIDKVLQKYPKFYEGGSFGSGGFLGVVEDFSGVSDSRKRKAKEMYYENQNKKLREELDKLKGILEGKEEYIQKKQQEFNEYKSNSTSTVQVHSQRSQYENKIAGLREETRRLREEKDNLLRSQNDKIDTSLSDNTKYWEEKIQQVNANHQQQIQQLQNQISNLNTKIEMYERFLQHKEKSPPEMPDLPPLNFDL